MKAMRAISFEVNSEVCRPKVVDFNILLFESLQFNVFTQVVKKCGELWRDEVDKETKAKYKTLYEDRLKRKSRFDEKVESKRPTDLESSRVDVEKLEDMNLRFKQDVDEKVNYPLKLSVGLPYNCSLILKLRFPSLIEKIHS